MKLWHFLFLFISIGVILRLFLLWSVPPAPSLDEVSIGYNAYSILKTSKDEYGYFYPILLRAYDDWRPGLYVYFVIPFIQFVGLNALAVRLPSVFMSIATLFGAYFLVRELIRSKQNDSKYFSLVPLLTTALLAISPWHIYISRLGHEVNLGLFTVVYGLMFFFLWHNNLKKSYFLLLSILFLGLSLYSYQSQKIITPLLIVSILILYRKDFIANKKSAFFAGIAGLFLLVPILYVSLQPEAMVRLRATSAFSQLDWAYEKNAIEVLKDEKSNNIVKKIYDNRRFIVPKILIANYMSHFNPYWLFLNTGVDRHKVPNLGLLYIWELPFILLGIYFFITSAIDRRIKFFVFIYFLISFIPAAVTTDSPHAMRVYTVLPLWQFFSALGLVYCWISVGNKYIKFFALAIGVFTYFASIFYMTYKYYYVFPNTQSSSFQFALSKTIPFLVKEEDKFDKIVVDIKDNLYQSYMFYLFFSKLDPVLYLNQGGTISGGYAESHAFGRYEFRDIDVSKEQLKKGNLYVLNYSESIRNLPIVKIFKNLDGKTGIALISP